MMNRELFWKMVESARKKSGKDLDAMHDSLLAALMKLTAADIYRWGQYYAAYHDLSDTPILYMAAYVTNSGGDDGFEYFRGWLIAQGRKVYMDALANPDSLAKLRIAPGDVLCFEEMMGMGYEAYADKLNETDEEPIELPLSDTELEKIRAEISFADSTGLDSEDACIAQIPKRIPKLCKKFGYEWDEVELSNDSEQNKTDIDLPASKHEQNAKRTGYIEVREWEGKKHAFYNPYEDKLMPALENAASVNDYLQIHQGKSLENIDSLAGFTNLNRLTFSAFEEKFLSLSNFSVLKKLTQLQDLALSNVSQLKSIDFVRHMPQLRRFCINNAEELEDISALEGLAHLEAVVLFDCPKIKTIPSLLASAETIKTVRFLNNKQLESIEGLCGLQAVEDLWLDNNKIEDISPLSGFSKLNHIDLSRNKISNISALDQLSHLEHLDLSRNKIEDISPLKNLRSLKNLFLSGNKLSDISALSELQHILYTLDLSKNKGLASIEALKNASIGALELKGTAVIDFSPVEHVQFIDTRDR